MAVLLKQISADKYQNQYEYLPVMKELKTDYPYDYIKTANFYFIKDSISKDGVAEIE